MRRLFELSNRTAIFIRDLRYESSRNGLGPLVHKILKFLFDIRRASIRTELLTWKASTRPTKSCRPTTGLVSVLLPVFDRTVELEKSIHSILFQSYSNLELVIVTDGSPKETFNIVERSRCDNRVRIIHFGDNSGTAVRGRNVGILSARGDYIAFQDSDDIAEPDRLEASVKALEESDADIIYGGWRAKVEADRADVSVRDGETFLPYPFSVKDLFRNNRICHSTVMMRRGVFDDIGGYKSQMRFREDHELWLRAAYYGYRFQPIPKVLATLRIHGRNNTLNFIDEDMKWYRLMLQEYKTRHHLEPIAGRDEQ